MENLRNRISHSETSVGVYQNIYYIDQIYFSEQYKALKQYILVVRLLESMSPSSKFKLQDLEFKDPP